LSNIFVSDAVGLSPITSLILIAGNGAFIGLKKAGIELSISFFLKVCLVPVDDEIPALCGPNTSISFFGSGSGSSSGFDSSITISGSGSGIISISIYSSGG
jgi:ethanolamine ammonia-lyase small subunit